MSYKYQVFIQAEGYVEIETEVDLDTISGDAVEEEIWEAFHRAQGENLLTWEWEDLEPLTPPPAEEE